MLPSGRKDLLQKGQSFSGYIEMKELPEGSLAAQLGGKQREKTGTINGSVWLGPAYGEYRMTEHSILMPNYERVLTLLVY